jgi:hypothetical protein
MNPQRGIHEPACIHGDRYRDGQRNCAECHRIRQRRYRRERNERHTKAMDLLDRAYGIILANRKEFSVWLDEAREFLLWKK